ncbi:hypothetical protein MMC07_003867 [Pseudocyphellaria aurata]|nr:hypothetical protein [Pseudocyphellaria aurata]
MRTIFLLALLSGIYAHPLGEDHGIESSHEKRCGDFSCLLLKPLPYPAGFSRRSCRNISNGRNIFADGLSVAGKKRSIIPITPTHTENTDRVPLLRTRMVRCREVTMLGRIANFPGPNGNTVESTLIANALYAFAFTFDSSVRHVSIWTRQSGSTFYRSIGMATPGTGDGLLLFRAPVGSDDPLIHFWIAFDYNPHWAELFTGPLNLEVNGIFTLFQLE